MPKVETYYQQAPFCYERYERVSKEDLTSQQRSRLVAYEVCDGGDGRCKCPQRCVRAVIERTEPAPTREDIWAEVKQQHVAEFMHRRDKR